MAFSDLRDEYIARVVKGKTFADVGGLWGTVNEKVSVAFRDGATTITMIDVTPEGEQLWQKFHNRMHDMGISEYQCISTDICNHNILEWVQPFEVVHCAGVLYHHPHPLLMINALKTITKEHLILTSAITQQTIENEKGKYTIPASGIIFVPALSEDERSILKVYWENKGVVALGLTKDTRFNLDNFGPWWWLPTPHVLAEMCKIVGFKVLDSNLTWGGNGFALLLQVQGDMG